MIPRTVKRLLDQRQEPRLPVDDKSAVLTIGANDHLVELLNISAGGAMLGFSGGVHVGERVTLQLLDRGSVRGQVRWIRDGRIGVSIDPPRR